MERDEEREERENGSLQKRKFTLEEEFGLLLRFCVPFSDAASTMQQQSSISKSGWGVLVQSQNRHLRLVQFLAKLIDWADDSVGIIQCTA
jgi:hypothetical protein